MPVSKSGSKSKSTKKNTASPSKPKAKTSSQKTVKSKTSKTPQAKPSVATKKAPKPSKAKAASQPSMKAVAPAKPVVSKALPEKRRPALTKSQLKELESVLMSERREHQRSSAGLEETLSSERENPDGSGDMADASGDVATLESATLLASHSSRALMEIDFALRRLRQNPEFFGVCEVSGEPIPFERLAVVPTARTTARNSRS